MKCGVLVLLALQHLADAGAITDGVDSATLLQSEPPPKPPKQKKKNQIQREQSVRCPKFASPSSGVVGRLAKWWEDRRSGPESTVTREEYCVPKKGKRCPQHPGANFLCRGVGSALCFINNFQEDFGKYMDSMNAASIDQSAMGATAQLTMDESLSTALSEVAAESAAAFGPLGMIGAFSGGIMNIIRFTNSICFEQSQAENKVKCSRRVSVSSIILSIVALIIAFTGVGIPIASLINGVGGLLLRKFGSTICQMGIKGFFRETFLDPSANMLRDGLSEWKDKTIIAKVGTLLLSPFVLLRKVLKLVGLLVLHILKSVFNTLQFIPQALGAGIMAGIKAATRRSDEDEKYEKDKFLRDVCCFDDIAKEISSQKLSDEGAKPSDLKLEPPDLVPGSIPVSGGPTVKPIAEAQTDNFPGQTSSPLLDAFGLPEHGGPTEATSPPQTGNSPGGLQNAPLPPGGRLQPLLNPPQSPLPQITMAKAPLPQTVTPGVAPGAAAI